MYPARCPAAASACRITRRRLPPIVPADPAVRESAVLEGRDEVGGLPISPTGSGPSGTRRPAWSRPHPTPRGRRRPPSPRARPGRRTRRRRSAAGPRLKESLHAGTTAGPRVCGQHATGIAQPDPRPDCRRRRPRGGRGRQRDRPARLSPAGLRPGRRSGGGQAGAGGGAEAAVDRPRSVARGGARAQQLDHRGPQERHRLGVAPRPRRRRSAGGVPRQAGRADERLARRAGRVAGAGARARDPRQPRMRRPARSGGGSQGARGVRRRRPARRFATVSARSRVGRTLVAHGGKLFR